MKLNEETIKNLILETLEDSLEEDLASAAKAEVASATRDATVEAAADIALAKELMQIKQMLQQLLGKQAPAAPAEKEAPKLEESFQITKGRLREIIAEEMKRAKKQG
jgi:hypothetical protein